MKKLTTKISVSALFVGLSLFIASQVQGQEGGYGTCNADNNTAPLPQCYADSQGNIHQDSSISWITGTSHCQPNYGVNSECWSTTITNAIKNTEPVTWSGNLIQNPGQLVYTDEGNEWIYPPFFSSAYCYFLIGVSPDESYQIYLCDNYTLGSDTQTPTSGGGCDELDLQ